jgi:hypothetical protein
MSSFCLHFIAYCIRPHIPHNSRVRFAALLFPLAFVISGCTLIPMKNLQPVIAPPNTPSCNDNSVYLGKEFRLHEGRPLRSERPVFHYVLPGPPTASEDQNYKRRFEDYDAAIMKRVESKLPAPLAQHRVTVAFREYLTAASGEAQLDAQIADGTLSDQNKINAERASIKKLYTAPNLKHSELKDFAKILFALPFKQAPTDFVADGPNIAVLGPRAKDSVVTRPKLDAELLAYLKAYYNGNFYDRMGTLISKPQLPTLSTFTNFSVPDSEIVAAETVIIEFIIDCIDTTPVMGDSADGLQAGTTYYPGNSTNEPTALATGLANYAPLQPTGCGITQANVWVLKDLATAASDQVATIGGLVVNTTGGISIGLGVLGKISIGDNQTLSDLLKTAVSEFALRATLATSYFTLRNVTFNPPQP